MHMGFDRRIEIYPRAMGWIVAVAALVVAVVTEYCCSCS